MPGAGWRQHVRAELERRERRARGLRLLLERHEKLYGRLDALQTLLAAAEEEEGQWPVPVGSCRRPQEVASVRVQQEMELIELRREREELCQRVALLTDILREAEAENKEQRAKMRCLAQDLAALTRRHEEAQCQAWALSQEAEGLRRELAETQGLMQEAQRKREELEARWVREKALEAGRLNQANEQHDRYQRRVRRLQEKLQEAREAAGMIPRPAAAESSPSDSTFSTSCEETSAEGGSSPKVQFSRQPPPRECSLALSKNTCTAGGGLAQWSQHACNGTLVLDLDLVSRRVCWLCELLRKRGLSHTHNPGVYKFFGGQG
uniref:autophagy-related protein 16-like isoform X3 n=1 Tax=Podarcis muralis TaxID=64176 RepID=UPI0010A024EA|nr:autophagy-related protein 16-like isoform X3 [Podarcis muralis]